METDYTVKYNYFNKETCMSITRVYPFTAYTNNISHDLKQLIGDIESVFCQMEGYKDRTFWSDESRKLFGEIRGRLLNNANNIQRLPETLCCKGVPINSMPASEMLAKIMDNN